jgi:hypothetical protein
MSDGCSGEARDALDETDSVCPKGPIRWIIWIEEEMGGCTATEKEDNFVSEVSSVSQVSSVDLLTCLYRLEIETRC